MVALLRFSFPVLFFLSLAVVGQDAPILKENRIIVKTKSTTKPSDFKNSKAFAFLKQSNTSVTVEALASPKQQEGGALFLVQLDASQNMASTIEMYQKSGLFEYVEQDFIGFAGGQAGSLALEPNDPLFHRQYALKNTGNFNLSHATVGADIKMEQAWEIEQGDEAIVVAILDSGSKLNHPEFAGRIWGNTDETTNNEDSDHNGYNDDLQGWDFVNNDNYPVDDHGHGTNVMGIAGASGNNGIGYAGVDWNCQLMVCKVINFQNQGYYSWWAEAIYYAVDNGAHVINMSLGGSSYSKTLEDAINYAFRNGVVVVACMMNFNDDTRYYPAGFENAIAVGSTDPDDTRSAPFFWDKSSGSNFGSHIDVVAPGNFIYGLNYLSDTNYDYYWGGTSQAAPLVAGLAALLLAQDPNRTPSQIKTIIEYSAEDQVGESSADTPGFDPFYGHGRINAYAALTGSKVLSKANQEKHHVEVYPNPAQHQLFIKSPDKIQVLKICNMQGQTLLRSNPKNSTTTSVDIRLLPKGLYLLQLFNFNNEPIVNQLFIKR